MASGQAAQFFAKVYSPTGATFRRVLDRTLFLDTPTIVREVGKPASDVTINLALPWDNFGYGQAAGINLFDLVKVYAVNSDNKGGILVFQGHIEEITGAYDKQNSHVQLRLFSLDMLFARSFWKSGGIYTITYTTADVDTMFSDAIDAVNTLYGATFFSKALSDPALSINVVFDKMTHLAALQQAAGFLPSTWYWRVEADGTVRMAQFNDSTQDHTLQLGKHVDTIQVVKSVLDTKNRIILDWGSPATRNEYNDAASETAYGTRMDAETESGITNLTSANARGNGDVARQKDPKTKTVIVVNANYAIETIKPGDTVKVLNTSYSTTSMLTGVLRIVRVEYDGTVAVLHLADVADNFGKELGLAIGN